MTDTSIRAELRRAAMEDDPWFDATPPTLAVAAAFLCPSESPVWANYDHIRWFFLLVAEAL